NSTLSSCHYMIFISTKQTTREYSIDSQHCYTYLYRHVPDPEGIIIRCKDKPGAIRTDGTGSYPVSMVGPGVEAVSRSRIPDLEGIIIRCRDKPGAIGTDGAVSYPISMTSESAAGLSRSRIPDLE